MDKIQMLQITPEELQEIISQGIKPQIEALKQLIQPKKHEDLMSRAEVAEFFQVDSSTILNWTKKNKLISYGIGKRVYYKREEIEQAIVTLK